LYREARKKKLFFSYYARLIHNIAGFGYAFDDVNIRDWSRPIGVDDFSGNPRDVLGLPLVNQPGTQFQYGVNIDWVGLLVERVANLSLDAYFKKYIFDPIGVKDISFFPTGDMKRRLVYMHHEDPDGRLRLGDHPYRAPLISRSGTDVFCAGGAGCFGVPAEYCSESVPSFGSRYYFG
jgi:CubicO group peptidase (beta-lactamase class C family)